MAKHNNKKNRLKYVFIAFACATACAFSGVMTACGTTETTTEEPETPVAKEDAQLLKNGNFEIFNIPEKKKDGNEPEYLIKTPDNWTNGGTSSYTMSGIISTSETAWAKMSADSLADDLDYNNKLDSSASNYLSLYVDYNGMKSSDIPYVDQYQALRTEDDLAQGETLPEDRKTIIANPSTHYGVTKKDDGSLVTSDGKPVYVDEKGEYFLEHDTEKDTYSQPISNVLMLHNYATSHNGIAQSYSSVEVELPASTAAEISVWVKTAHLKFNQGKDVAQDRGANITVTQTAGSFSLDKFKITSINTEKLISEKAIEDKHNGWVQYTVYVNACDFASSKIKLELGLGEEGYTTEGYAFFDDVTVTKYISLKDERCSFTENEDKLSTTTSYLSSEGDEKIYQADSYVRNGGEVSKPRYSTNFHYWIDLASGNSENSADTYSPVSFNDVRNLTTGYTVDDDNYVSSKNPIAESNRVGFTSATEVDDKWRLPFKSSLKTDDDLLAYVTTGSSPFSESQTNYYEKLNEALKSAADLPKNNGAADNMLVMLSAYGAAYTTSFDLTIGANGYDFVSFWVKTSDMEGKTAATLKVTQKDSDTNSANFTLETTDKVTDIGEEDGEKDIFNGWVQCFFFIKNELDHPTDYTVEFSFGNTTIKGTDVHNYKNGWVALANMQTLSVSEKVFGYTDGVQNTASLTISEEAKKNTQAFDEAYANQSHEIKNNMVVPSTYKGVNGGSSAIVNNGHVSIPYDELNNNKYNGEAFTGLINKEHFIKDSYANKEWYNNLCTAFTADASDSKQAWNRIFGDKSFQPLVISNVERTSFVEVKNATAINEDYYVKDGDGNFNKVAADATFDEKETYYKAVPVINYGYIGENKEVAADSYATVSVRVKVSGNAIAYIYLVDTTADKNVLSFKAPSYSFYYDIDGNVLKAEPKTNATVTEQRENVAYTLRDDGLYQDKDGNLYANTWNYKKLYYTVDSKGSKIYLDNIKDGEKYLDENGNEGNHYLVTGDGTKVYEFTDGKYHYIVNGVTQSAVVNPFDTQYARYNYENSSESYIIPVKGKEHADWVTVTFVLHAGSEAKSYRLELWSGERDKAITEGNEAGGYVLFDHSYLTVSDDKAKTEYEQEIIKEYQKKLAEIGKLDGIDTANKNIKFYEELAKTNEVEIETKYKAHYYTFSLYDSADYKPFNKETASEGATGYDYSVSEQTEILSYLQVAKLNSYTVFADYASMDKSITLNDSADTDDDDDAATEEDNESDGSIWLLASSIILVIALLFAIAAIFLKDVVKKARRNKVTSKNNYNQRKANHYKRKLHLKQEEIIEVDPNADKAADEPTVVPAEEPADEPVEDVPADEPADEPVEGETPDNGDKQ